MYKTINNKFHLFIATLLCALLVAACSEQTPTATTPAAGTAGEIKAPPASESLVAVEPAATSATLSHQQQVNDCSFSRAGSWWSGSFADLPASIANNPVTGKTEFCEFYQFAEDWFLYLISPSATAGIDNWQDQARFPVLQTNGSNSCDGGTVERALNIRTVKAPDDGQDFVLPERVDQAGGEHAIYDQNGNVVFYEIGFSRNLCDYPAIQAMPNFPGKTVELKLAWRILTGQADDGDFYQSEATIDDQQYTLGLIGWHIVVTADNHPEMVWITLDHVNNAIDCAAIGPGQNGFDFTSQACAQDAANCTNLNQTQEFTKVTLSSGAAKNDICAAYPYGTVEGQSIDTDNGMNIALIEKLNNELQNVIFIQSGIPDSLPVWKNYQVTGALWISDITKNSKDTKNQRGSLQLANTVMETSFQGKASDPSSTLNCFGCHQYNGTASGTSNTAYAAGFSHIFDNVILGQCKDEASSVVINNQTQAEATCPSVCAAVPGYTKWNGQWTNNNGPMTVCGCCPYPVN